MKLNFWRRKREEQHHSQTLTSLAVRPVSVNTSLLINQAKTVLTKYLAAVYNLKPEMLPMGDMDEQFYYEAGRRIFVEDGQLEKLGISARNAALVSIDDIQLDRYEDAIYAIHSLTYRATYRITGTINRLSVEEPSDCSGKVLIHFQYDNRMGWLLDDVQSPQILEKNPTIR